MRKFIATNIILLALSLLSLCPAFCVENKEEKSDFLPLAVGNTWKYVIHFRSKSHGDTTLLRTNKISGVATVNGKESFVVEHIVNSMDNFLDQKEYLYREDNEIIRSKILLYDIAQRGVVYGTEKIREKGDIIEREDPHVPETLLSLPLTPGKKWVSQGTYFTVIGKEKVGVLAGDFECYKIKLEFEGEKGFIYQYYANSVGLIKEETYEDIKDSDLIFPTVIELSEYYIVK